ncbi:epoxyqueuosine reductase [bacterium]|nr:epoxyqueuosine reductase [bacterium]
MEQNKKEQLTHRIIDLAKRLGADLVGIATKDTLKGGPPSTDLTYVLPGANSAVVFAISLDQSIIEPFIEKSDFDSFNVNNVRTNTLASGISLDLSKYLEMKGFRSVALNANIDYRKDTKGGVMDELPPISHRYLAVRSGVGFLGFSGNLLTKQFGAAVILGSLVTQAELIPTDPINPENNYCDQCKVCTASCASGYMDPKEMITVTMGGMDFSYSRRRHHWRCDYVCGGFSGLHQSKKWSTWSPARFAIPEKDEEFAEAFIKAAPAYKKRPKSDVGFYHFLMPGNVIELTCCFCQLVCHPDKEVRKKRLKMIRNSGVTIQRSDGSLASVSPDDAEKWLASLDKETRALYMEVE